MTNQKKLEEIAKARNEIAPKEAVITIIVDPAAYLLYQVTVPWVAEEPFAGETLEEAAGRAIAQAAVVNVRESEVPDA